MNTEDLIPAANKTASALSGIKIALICLAVLTGVVLVIAGMAADDAYGDSAPSASLVLTGFATLLGSVWIYALFGFLEYTLRLLVALVQHTQTPDDMGAALSLADDFDQHVATAPIDPVHGHFQGRGGNGGTATIHGSGTAIGGRGGDSRLLRKDGSDPTDI